MPPRATWEELIGSPSWLATIAVAGPRSLDVIASVAPDLDVSKEGFGSMELRHTTLSNGLAARICRITFSGELAFEVDVPSWYGLATSELVAEADAGLGITPYGTEAMHVLRAQKAYPIVGHDTDGYPLDLCVDDYRYSMLQAPLIIVLGWTVSARTERGDRMFLAMTERSCAAIRDHDGALQGVRPCRARRRRRG